MPVGPGPPGRIPGAGRWGRKPPCWTGRVLTVVRDWYAGRRGGGGTFKTSKHHI